MMKESRKFLINHLQFKILYFADWDNDFLEHVSKYKYWLIIKVQKKNHTLEDIMRIDYKKCLIE